jgi:hypothetical protein
MSSPVCFNDVSCALASYYTTAIWPFIGAPLMAHVAIGAHHARQFASAAYEQLQSAAVFWNGLDLEAQNATLAAGTLLSALLMYQLFLYLTPSQVQPAPKVQAATAEPKTHTIRRSTRISKAPERFSPERFSPAAPPKRKRKAATPKGGRPIALTCGSRYIYHVVSDAAGQPIVNKAFYNARTGFVEPDGGTQMTLHSFVQQHAPSNPTKPFSNLYVKTRAALVPLARFKV